MGLSSLNRPPIVIARKSDSFDAAIYGLLRTRAMTMRRRNLFNVCVIIPNITRVIEKYFLESQRRKAYRARGNPTKDQLRALATS
ncbi:MAG: hypothetical protein ACRBDI_09480 [Alphaproteobacteria bacterium]